MVKNYKKMFRDAKNTLAEREGRGVSGPAKPWDMSWVEYVREQRLKNRQALLDELVPERVCPACGETKINDRQWVVLTNVQSAYFDHHSCVCRGCYRKSYVNKFKNPGGRPRKDKK